MQTQTETCSSNQGEARRCWSRALPPRQPKGLSCTLQPFGICHSPGKEHSGICWLLQGLRTHTLMGSLVRERPELLRFCAAVYCGARSHRVRVHHWGVAIVSMYILDVGVGTDDVLNFIRVGVLEGKGAGSHPEPFPVFGSESEHD